MIFNTVDIIVVVLMAFGVIRGVHRKLSGEFAGLISSIIVIGAALLFHKPLGTWMIRHTRLSAHPAAASALSYLLLIIGFFILMLVLRLILRNIMRVTFNEKIDAVGGGLAGLLKSALVAIIIIAAIGMWPYEYTKRITTRESLVGRMVFTRVLPTLKAIKQGND